MEALRAPASQNVDDRRPSQLAQLLQLLGLAPANAVDYSKPTVIRDYRALPPSQLSADAGLFDIPERK